MFGSIATMRAKRGKEDELLKFFEAWGGGRGSRIDGPVRVYVSRSTRDPGVLINVVLFDSREHYEANAADPAQNAWYQSLLPLLEAPPEWHDHEVLLAYEFVPPSA